MFHPFKKNEQEKQSVDEKIISDQSENFENIPEDSIDLKLEALSDYFAECEKNGIELTKEMVEQEINERLGLRAEELLGDQISDPEISLTHQEIISEIKKVLEQKAESKGTPLSFLRDKLFKSKFAKAAVMSLLVGLKINSMQAAEKTDVKDNNKQEFKKADIKSNPDGKTYQAQAEDFSDPNKPIVISATSNFETNKADLKDLKSLEKKLDSFLSSINDNNFESLMAQDWVVKGSSDERHTNWEGGNEGLTQARIEAVKNAVLKILAKHDFSQQLSEDKVKRLLAKEIYQLYPKNGAEKGVTYLTDLDNPETGEKYTDEEINILKTKNPVKYNKLLDQCRYTNFELKAKGKIFENEKNYDRYYMIIDNSASMSDNREAMSKELKGLNIDKPFVYANFSGKLGELQIGLNSKDLANKILRYSNDTGSGNEKAFSSAISILEKIESNNASLIKNNKKLPASVLYIATDETLQDVNLMDKVKELSERNNVELRFIIFSPEGDRSIKLNLEQVQEQIDANNFVKNSIGEMTLNKIVDEYGREIFK